MERGSALLFLQRGAGVLHLVGSLGGELSRPLVHPDGPACRPSRSVLVWVAVLDRMWVQGWQTRRVELAALPQPGTGAGGTIVVGDGSGDLDHGRGGSRARSARAAPLPGAVAVEPYCSPQRPSRPAAGRGGGQAVQGQAQTGPELFQSRLQ